MLIKESIMIETLGREREMLIYLPDDYQTSNKKYPVILINDGQNAFIDEESYSKKSWGFIESANKLGLDLVMVGIFCNFEPLKREDEYGPWVMKKEYSREYGTERLVGGEGKKYVQFLIRQLKPYLDQKYPTKKDDYAIVGSSMGALISFYAFLKYPKVFKKCALLSTPFWIYEREFKMMMHFSRIQNNMLYMDYGGKEDDQRYTTSNEVMYPIIKKKIKNLDYRFFKDDIHSESSWAKRVPYFLEMFYKDA